VRDARKKPVGLALAGNDLNLARHESVAAILYRVILEPSYVGVMLAWRAK